MEKDGMEKLEFIFNLVRFYYLKENIEMEKLADKEKNIRKLVIMKVN